MIPTIPHNGLTDPDILISRALQQTVQVPPSVTRDGVQSGFSLPFIRTSWLPPRGTRARELALRELYFLDENTIVQGSFTGIAKTIASMGWEIKNISDDDKEDSMYGDMARTQGWRLKRNDAVSYFQEVFRQANFGQGWGTFIAQMYLDFSRYDAGGYIEVIASGDSFDAPYGVVTGLAHLDPIKCIPTGDPLYPAIYYDRWGGLHVMNHARVVRLVDMDDGDEYRPGYGNCALSRACAVVMSQLNQTRYINQRLDDKPPPGVTIIGGIMKADWETVTRNYTTQMNNDAKPVFGQRLFYHTPDPSLMPKMESMEFAQPPEKFDARVFLDIDFDKLSVAMNVDRQELVQLSGGGALGSAMQSKMLEQKSRGKGVGYFLAYVERKMNDVLPDGFEFEFKMRNTQESVEDADKASKWASVAKDLVETGVMTAAEARTMMASECESIQDAINDAPRANDLDTQVVGADNTAGAMPIAPQMASTTQPASTPQTAQPTPQAAFQKKSYDLTESQFVNDVADLLRTASQGSNPYLDRRAFGVTMRSFLKNYGLQAYKDGMAQGGVYVDMLDNEDNADYMSVFMSQQQYITGLADDVFVKKSIGMNNAYARATMWGKSLQAFDDAGLESANGNAMYRWVLDPLKENCPDCLRLNNQVHRIHNWKKSGWMPRSSKLKCWGARCGCKFERTTEMAYGGF